MNDIRIVMAHFIGGPLNGQQKTVPPARLLQVPVRDEDGHVSWLPDDAGGPPKRQTVTYQRVWSGNGLAAYVAEDAMAVSTRSPDFLRSDGTFAERIAEAGKAADVELAESARQFERLAQQRKFAEGGIVHPRPFGGCPSAPVRVASAPCSECRGSGRYVGIAVDQPCRACAGSGAK